MPDAFFTSKSRKRKRSDTRPTKNDIKKSKPKLKQDQVSSDEEEWGGIDDLDLRPHDPDPGASGDEDPDETPAQKRLRLAQIYLDSVKDSLADGEYDAAEIDKQLISSRLQQDVLSHSGKIHLFIADSFSHSLLDHNNNNTPLPTLRTRGHRLSITSAVTSESCKYLYTAGKEGTIIKWDLSTGKKLAVIHKARPSKDSKGKAKAEQSEGHTDEILALALSSDGKYLASGGKDRRLLIWDASSLTLLKSFHGPLNHKDTISALSFRSQTHQLYTASYDRTLKLYDLTPNIMGYVETLFGHQHPILSLNSLKGESCISAGGRDKTVRYWKILDETQLVFRGGGSGKRDKLREILEGGVENDDEKEQGRREKNYVEGSLECVAMIDETTFITGGDSGTISLWSTSKKKPIFTHLLAHGITTSKPTTPDVPPVHNPRWITALACLPYSDLFVSGSYDGYIRLWKLDSKIKSFSPLLNGGNSGIPIPGIINSLQLIQPPKSFFTTQTGTETPTTRTKPEWPPVLPTIITNNTTTIPGPVLIMVGTGQEHRFGRWLSVKNNSSIGQEEEGGGINATYVITLIPGLTGTGRSESRTLNGYFDNSR